MSLSSSDTRSQYKNFPLFTQEMWLLMESVMFKKLGSTCSILLFQIQTNLLLKLDCGSISIFMTDKLRGAALPPIPSLAQGNQLVS